MGTRDRRYKQNARTIAEYTLENFNKEKKTIIQKYLVLLQRLVQNYISDRDILTSSQQSEWDSKLVPGWSEKLKNAKYTHLPDSGHYQSGVVSEYIEDGSKIVVKNIAEPQPPIFNADPSSFTSETPLTDWIVNGRIHPLPPLGMWWKREDWDKMFYDAFPYFDEIQQTSEYKALKNSFSKELSQSYTKSMQKAIDKFYARRKIR